MNLSILLELAILSAATAVASMTLSKGVIFRSFREWLQDRSWGFPGRVLACPYCTSHWIAMVAILARPGALLTGAHPVLDFIVRWLVVVFGAAIGAGIIYRAYAPMNRSEEE